MDNVDSDPKLEDTTFVNGTSPSHLENVRESHSLTFTSPLSNQLGLRAKDNSDLTRGSMREQEEQLNILRKENFNLKLRVYFLEEQKSENTSYEACNKQNIELKIEIETLKDEIDEKQKILEQAAQAIEAMEENQTEMKTKFDEKVQELQNKISDLEDGQRSSGYCNSCNSDCKEVENNIPSTINSVRSCSSSFELRDDMFKKQNIVSDLENKIMDLQADLMKRDGVIADIRNKLDSQIGISNNLELLLEQNGMTIAELQLKVSSYKSQICELEECLDLKDNELKTVQQKLNTIQHGEPNLVENRANDFNRIQEIMHLNELVAKRDSIIKKHEEAHRCACKVIQSFMQKNKEMSRELDTLKRTQPHMSATTASESENSSGQSQTFSNFCKHGKNTNSPYLSEDARHEREIDIELLESFYKKCLSKGDSKSTTKSANSNPLMTKSGVEQNLDTDGGLSLHVELVQENKKLLRQIEELRNEIRNVPEKENNDTIKQLHEELAQCKNEYDSVKAELKTLQISSENVNVDNTHWQDICLTLKGHLEELAGFLKSLLRSDLNLSLPDDKFEKIKLAVDKSLDLSRSVSLSVSGIMKEGNSLAQLSSLTAYLDTSALSGIERLSGESTNDNIILDQAETISHLKNTIVDLKKQLNNRHSFKFKSDTRPNQESSESEAWSEPDRNISFSRMGLKEPASTSPSTSPRRKSNSFKANQKIFSRKLAMEESHQDVAALQNTIKLLEGRIAENDKKLLERECDMLKADNEFSHEKLKFASELEDYKLQKLQCDNTLKETLHKLSASEANIVVLREQIHQMCKTLSQSEMNNKEKELKFALFDDQINTMKSEMEIKDADLRFAEENLRCLQHDMKDLSDRFTKLKDENEKLTLAFKESLQVNEEFCMQIKSLTKEKNDYVESHLNEVGSLKKKFDDDISKNWVAKIDYESKCDEVEAVLILLGEKETELIHQQTEEQEKLRQLKTEYQMQIDEMKCKEADLLQKLLEKEADYKTLCHNVDQLTVQMSEATIDKSKASKEKMQLEKQLSLLKSHYEKKVREMQLKISELEKESAENKNKLITLQTSNKRLLEPFCGTSNENSSDEGAHDDRLGVSSPDLGIDSDQGNMSNNELISIERPLLKTLELTKSMTNILDFHKHDQDEDKVKILEQENIALRKKIVKMRHTLQEALGQIVAANKKKRQVEKDIAEQLCKTHGVLRQVRTNLESNANK
ncbi:centrosomin-like isoform X2 [Ctenocephalides felis]|uniref:centrosomin-like isoform X2 n=1 Tax=Ctenocephalides felis TaxID=7515 RepID=UPI000E6E324E|nr:centrosomin-like isoform X2 [Ctenocephalides felis]